MPPRLPLLCLAIASLAACTGTAVQPPPVQLVDGNGTHPARGMDGVLELTIAQEGEAPEPEIADIRAGEFQVDVPIVDYEVLTEIQATLTPEGSAPELIGATTPFLPAYFGGGLRVVMGARSTCVALTQPRLDGARILPGLELVESNLIQIGGERSGAEVSSVVALSPLLLTVDANYELPALTTDGMGRTRMRRIAGTTLIVGIDEEGAILYDATGQATSGARDSEVMAHGGVGLGSTLADLGSAGVAIVGGLSGVDRVRDVTRVRDRDDQVSFEDLLMVGRNGASAVAFRGGLLVAGGQAEGERLFEWVSLDGATPVAFGDTTARSGGILVANATTAFYYLGRAPDGTLLDTSWVITGCPVSCTAVPGPTTTTPRFGAASAAWASATVVLGGEEAAGPSRVVEEVVLAGIGEVNVLRMGDLTEPRADTTAVTLGGGTVLVAGGRGEDRALDSMELCFPAELDPLSIE